MNDSLSELTARIEKFRSDRDWAKFHNPKDSAISLTLEAAELLEHFQWKTPDEISEYLKTNKTAVAEELVDVLYWVLLMSKDLKIDLVREFKLKMVKNESKYPIEKSKGRHNKYTDYNEATADNEGH